MKKNNYTYIKDFKNFFDYKNIEDKNERYKDNTYSFSDEVINQLKNQKLGNIKN